MSLIADPMGFYDDGVIMEITDYVEKYMPDYVAYLDANPSLKVLPQLSVSPASHIS